MASGESGYVHLSKLFQSLTIYNKYSFDFFSGDIYLLIIFLHIHSYRTDKYVDISTVVSDIRYITLQNSLMQGFTG